MCQQKSHSCQSGYSIAHHATMQVLLIPEFCPEGQRQRLTKNNSILLVENYSKKALKPIESPH